MVSNRIFIRNDQVWAMLNYFAGIVRIWPYTGSFAWTMHSILYIFRYPASSANAEFFFWPDLCVIEFSRYSRLSFSSNTSLPLTAPCSRTGSTFRALPFRAPRLERKILHGMRLSSLRNPSRLRPILAANVPPTFSAERCVLYGHEYLVSTFFFRFYVGNIW